MFLEKIYKKLPVLVFDLLSIPTAWSIAYWLQSNMRAIHFSHMNILPILMLLQVSAYYHFKVYRGLWRFSSLADVLRIIKAVFSATLILIPALYCMGLLQGVPRSIFPLYDMLLIALLCGGRLIFRMYNDVVSRAQMLNPAKRVLIIGAGLAGEGLIRDLKRMRTYLPVGLIDDDATKRGLEVHGIQVLGQVEELPALVAQYKIDLIFIAIPSANSATMRRIVNQCEVCHVPFHTLPSIHALAAGRVEVDALRPVKIEDLLGRDQVQLDWEKIAASIQDRRVLVTGGGGSIGSELSRQIAKFRPKKLLILDNNEFNLYNIEQELKEEFPQLSIEIALVSIVDKVAVKEVFQAFRPEYVFHAAAYKHVPLLEDQVRVAVLNNVLGTQIIAEASVVVGAHKFILISTDKAVNPTNIMGTTKRVAEIYCQNLSLRVNTQFITVRFGNVLASVGSVVPLFQKQLQQGGPLTVTHPDIERYFMTIAEAAQLILQAMVNGTGNEIFVLDMGEPVKIRYLAEQMIRLAGKEPEKDIAISYIGLRPGEKLYEELFLPSEELMPTAHKKLFKARVSQLDWDELAQTLRMITTACESHQNDELIVLLKSLVPEFRYEHRPSLLV